MILYICIYIRKLLFTQSLRSQFLSNAKLNAQFSLFNFTEKNLHFILLTFDMSEKKMEYCGIFQWNKTIFSAQYKYQNYFSQYNWNLLILHWHNCESHMFKVRNLFPKLVETLLKSVGSYNIELQCKGFSELKEAWMFFHMGW